MSKEWLKVLYYSICAPLLVIFIAWLAKICWSFFNKVKVKVLVHEAVFLNSSDSNTYYFIKVINSSTKEAVTISHVWVNDKNNKINLINSQRPLPYKLEPTEIWETWIKKDLITDKINIFKSVIVKLSNEKILESTENKNVPGAGHVAGGI